LFLGILFSVGSSPWITLTKCLTFNGACSACLCRRFPRCLAHNFYYVKLHYVGAQVLHLLPLSLRPGGGRWGDPSKDHPVVLPIPSKMGAVAGVRSRGPSGSTMGPLSSGFQGRWIAVPFRGGGRGVKWGDSPLGRELLRLDGGVGVAGCRGGGDALAAVVGCLGCGYRHGFIASAASGSLLWCW
jgi:hypothetical protein